MNQRQFSLIAAFLLGISLSFVGCGVSSPIAQVGDKDFVLEQDERSLWKESKEEEDKLDKSGFIYRDSIATTYVNTVLNNLIPPNVKASGVPFHAVILKNPLLNAFAYPNGSLYIHTGILTHIENEAQLATIIGHEINHVICRHTVKEIRSAKNTTDALAFFQVATIPFGFFGVFANILGTVGTMAAISGYSRDAEREADTKGFALVLAAGYDIQESPKVFQRLKEDLEEQHADEPFFFGSHPKLNERISNFNELVAHAPIQKSPLIRAHEYDSVMTPVVLMNTEMDLQMGRYESAQKSAERVLLLDSCCSQAHYLIGETYRQRGDTTEQQLAFQAYQKAVICDSANANAFKGIGLLAQKRKDIPTAQTAFRQYLKLQPHAADRSYIEKYLKKME
ncbi:MAG TPA: M48 family metalloprotease [Bacteroidota bacterium]|nr:M48 family metalloprotease [Bacteroidota bacterium]